MFSITNVIDKIIDLSTDEGYIYTGYLTKPGNNVWFVGRLKTTEFFEMENSGNHSFDLRGEINGQSIILRGASNSNSSQNSQSPFISLKVLANEIVLCKKQNTQATMVSNIEADVPGLNWFFRKPVVEFCGDISSPCKADPQSICISNVEYDFTISRSIKIEQTQDSFQIENSSQILLKYQSPVPIMQAIKDMEYTRQFFCFLSDDYVKYPSEYRFSVDKHEISDNAIWLNDNHKYKPEKKRARFHIQYDEIQDDLENIWLNWKQFRSNPACQPIIEIYLDIISNKSVGVTRFLNLCQAIEVYSRLFRKDGAQESWRRDKEKPENIDREDFPKGPTLYHRLVDSYNYHLDIRELSNDTLEEECKNITDIRNFCTHYDNGRRIKLEERLGDIMIARTKYEAILHLYFLANIYKQIGVNNETIKMNQERIRLRFCLPTTEIFESP